jgi:hypothetical protein
MQININVREQSRPLPAPGCGPRRHAGDRAAAPVEGTGDHP